ncbi:MAG: hypothetical protein GEU81_04310 [Nitriliruptorales bacterium]|nr:hypothetical protein [Nitriliruptorales bacterium]
MYGWRARIGLVAPSRGDTFLYEFYKVVPDGVMGVPYSCDLTVFDRSEFDRVRAAYEQGVRTLSREKVDIIYVGGTPVQLSAGPEGFNKLSDELRSMTNVPVVTTAESELAALQRTGAAEVAVLTPHEDDVNARLRAFLEDGGVRVGRMRGLGLHSAYEISFVSDYTVYREAVALAKEATTAEAVHITCPRWPTLLKIAEMEETCGRPVTTSCQAVLWRLLTELSIEPRKGSWGSLFNGS